MKKIAIVYDWMDKWGGVERVLLTLHELFPQAEFYTSYFDQKKASWAQGWKIQTSFIQKLPELIKTSRMLSFPFYPYAFESFDLTAYDLVISVTSSFAKGVITRPETKHICYLLTPTRYVWGQTDEYLQQTWKKVLFAGKLAKMREWDYVAAQRPDKMISISQTVADRCKKYYHRESEVIYPPLDLNYWGKIKGSLIPDDKKSPYYLVVSRLEPYKKVDLVINTFRELPDKKVIIVGTGTQETSLKEFAPPNVEFRDTVTDHELAKLYTGAEALIMPQEEDFGYVALEAQYFGCPVISYSRGGVSETVVSGKSGVFFEEQTVASLKNTVERFHTISYNLRRTLDEQSVDGLHKFSKEHFQKEFLRNI